MKWKEAAVHAIINVCKRRNSLIFHMSELTDYELQNIKNNTHTIGKTPENTLAATLQELRDLRIIDFVDYEGEYRLLFDILKNRDLDLLLKYYIKNPKQFHNNS